MKLSARNVLPAIVKSVTPGAVDTEVVVELTRHRGGFDHHQKICG
jgi:molybdopterin-binding protein